MAKLYYEKLTDYQKRATDGLKRRTEKLEQLKTALQNLATSENFQGTAATNITAYLQEVHINGMINGLLQAVDNLQQTLDFYVIGYPAVDQNGVVFKLIDDDLAKHQTEVANRSRDYHKILTSATKTMTKVEHIKATSGLAKVTKNSSAVIDNLTTMKKLAFDQQTDWHRYDSDHANDFATLDTLIGQLNSLVGQYAGGTVPTMADYQGGGFNLVAGEQYTNALASVSAMNQSRAAADKQARQSLSQIRTSQKQYEKAVAKQKKIEAQKQKDANRTAGAASLFVDLSFIVVGGLLTLASGGAAVPLLLLATAAAFDANTLYSDFDKARTGKNEGTNFIKSNLQWILGQQIGEYTYETANIASGIIGSSGAYKELAEKGIVVNISRESKIFTSVMNKNIGKNIVAGTIKSSQTIFPARISGVTAKEVSKVVTVTYGKKSVTEFGEYQIKKEIIEPISNGTNEILRDGTYKVTGNEFISDVTGDMGGKGIGKGIGFVKNKTIDSTSQRMRTSMEETVEEAKLKQVQSIIKSLNQQYSYTKYISNLGDR
ncbi:T7SS effector LXG polymorphic toxin [Latilactobacillus fuchuensis]|uniref:T7SS effector LXG polymorphic toxin n=1 Tax=Latilactobacillus fuchuensis TaxID=164393 RepID=UPI00131A0EE2|nr:T7SS effector LXG polymorphic toxin [Latilactobacillus fuchuensis]